MREDHVSLKPVIVLLMVAGLLVMQWTHDKPVKASIPVDVMQQVGQMQVSLPGIGTSIIYPPDGGLFTLPPGARKNPDAGFEASPPVKLSCRTTDVSSVVIQEVSLILAKSSGPA